jgi:hypothetical protein
MEPGLTPVHWKLTPDAEYPYDADVAGRHWRVRLGDFPEEALYTLLVDGKETATFDDWPAAWAKPSLPKAKYYLVNDRPVRFILTPEGSMDVQALNMRTGEFERAMEYLSKIMAPFADVDSISETDFNVRVTQVRKNLA